MRCCEIVPSVEPIHGGPSKTVVALSGALAELGEDVTLLTTDPQSERERSNGRLSERVFRRDWPQSLCPSRGLRRYLSEIEPDLVHHHSLWLRTLHYAHRRARTARVPLVVSPRGMMSDWAWNFHRWQKRIARHVLHPGAFEAVAGWHATSNEERDDIRARGFTQPICVAPNGVAASSPEEFATAGAHWSELCPDVTRRPTALFYSRLHKKKRVLELIDLWIDRAPAEWLLLMVGIPEDYTAAQLETYVMRRSAAGRVRVYNGDRHPPPFAVASLFLLPSHNENFGLAIAEAMANGVPALVTDTTPWTEINASGGGWCVPWSEYPSALDAALSEKPAALAARGKIAQAGVLAGYSWQRAARLLLDFYRELRSNAAAR